MSDRPSIVLIGGGGHCHSVLDVIEQENRFHILGIIDDNLPLDHKILGYSVIGADADIPKFNGESVYFLITVGHIKSYSIRLKLAKLLEKHKYKLASVISPRAYVSSHARIGRGTVVMHNAFVNANVEIGDHCIINTHAGIEHDAVIGDFCHISTGAIVNGNCIIEKGCFLGSNSTISNGKNIVRDSIIGAGTFYK
ncbi:acetyltransferase [Salegentibacter sp. UBA1130]|uniref:acetyltransferase n=1 Tax=Salegentibacter sp. UBA1130 TaxID=1947451 RepID=UPI00257AEB24|nr:acetyltransferase [Salegentibacter sp. UBA1130]